MRDLSRPLAPTYGDPKKKAAKKKPNTATKAANAKKQLKVTRDSISSADAKRRGQVANDAINKKNTITALRAKNEGARIKAAAAKRAAQHKASARSRTNISRRESNPTLYEQMEDKALNTIKSAYGTASKGLKKARKALNKPQPGSPAWKKTTAHGKAMSGKKTSTMSKTRNPKPGPYQY